MIIAMFFAAQLLIVGSDEPKPADISFSFNRQAEGDRRTPARLQLRAGETLVVRAWVAAQAPAWIPEPVESFVSAQIRDGAGRVVHAQAPAARRAQQPRSIPPNGARNFLMVVLPRCHTIPAGTYTLDLRYASPPAGRAPARDLTARTVLEIQPAPPMPRRHLTAEVLKVALSEDFQHADGQIIVHNDGCEVVECAMLRAGRLQVVVRDKAGRTVCQPDPAPKDNGQAELATVPPGQGVGLGVGSSRCDPQAVKRAGPVESLRARVRYDSSGLPGWRLTVDTEVPVEIQYLPRSGVPR